MRAFRALDLLADGCGVAAVVMRTMTRVVTNRSASRQQVGFELDVDDGRRIRCYDDVEIVHGFVEIGVVAGQNIGLANRTIERCRSRSWATPASGDRSARFANERFGDVVDIVQIPNRSSASRFN